MNREDLLEAVSDLAGTESADQAERATLATLRTRGEHVSAGEAEDVADGLPGDPTSAVTDRSDETPESFSVDECVSRVMDRERIDGPDQAAATRHVRAVMAALVDAGIERELQEAREQLPNEFATLFERDALAADAE